MVKRERVDMEALRIFAAEPLRQHNDNSPAEVAYREKLGEAPMKCWACDRPREIWYNSTIPWPHPNGSCLEVGKQFCWWICEKCLRELGAIW